MGGEHTVCILLAVISDTLVVVRLLPLFAFHVCKLLWVMKTNDHLGVYSLTRLHIFFFSFFHFLLFLGVLTHSDAQHSPE